MQNRRLKLSKLLLFPRLSYEEVAIISLVRIMRIRNLEYTLGVLALHWAALFFHGAASLALAQVIGVSRRTPSRTTIPFPGRRVAVLET